MAVQLFLPLVQMSRCDDRLDRASAFDLAVRVEQANGFTDWYPLLTAAGIRGDTPENRVRAWAWLLRTFEPETVEGDNLRGVYADRPEPREYTDELPGTSEKVEVMIARFERGEALFHLLDARHIEEPG